VKRVIFTADDFGLSMALNEAVEEAHRKGALNTASLMVGADAAGDALERARRLPALQVGLHLVLVDGRPVSAPHAIPDLLDSKGAFSSHLVRAGLSFFFRTGVRQQLEQEIRAQFEAFQKTGLALDHVNCHHHMQLHATIADLILKVGREFGVPAVRYPNEPAIGSWRASRQHLHRRLISRLLLPWLILLKKRLHQAGVRSNDFVFGMHDSGNMNLKLVLRFLEQLPNGVTEIYFHPATGGGQEQDNPSRQEFEALTNPALLQALKARGIRQIGFSDL
jgi:chitin disaccharide deacetylase